MKPLGHTQAYTLYRSARRDTLVCDERLAVLTLCEEPEPLVDLVRENRSSFIHPFADMLTFNSVPKTG